MNELGVTPTEDRVDELAGRLGEAESDEERQQLLQGAIESHVYQQTVDDVQAELDGWVTDSLGDQASTVDRSDLLKDAQSMAYNGMTSAQIETAIRERLDNVKTRGLDSLTGGMVVEGFGEADVINAGLALDRRDREETQRSILDTMQVTLDVGSDEELAERFGVGVDQLGDTLLVRSAQNAENPQDIIAQLQQDPRYQANAERRRLAGLAADAIADGASLGVNTEDMGLEGVTDPATIGEIIENSSGVDAVLADLGRSLGPDGEAVPINLTQEQRNELALERGFLNRNGFSGEEIDAHLSIRANNLHWQNTSQQDIANWQAQGVIPEFGYDPAQSGRQLDLENNAARTMWALGVAAESADAINAQHAEDIGVTQGVQDATNRLHDHWMQNELNVGSDLVKAIGYTFGNTTSYTEALNRLQENPSVDEIQAFRNNIDEVLNNDIYNLTDEERAMLEASRSEFDGALAAAQATRDAAAGDDNLALSQAQYDEMIAEFDHVNSTAGGWIGRFNKEALGLDHATLGAHADLTAEEITAMEALASIPADERTPEQHAAYDVLNQALLGRNTVTNVTSGVNRFRQGDQVAAGFESFINDNAKQSVVLGSAIVGTGVSFVNPAVGGAILVGGTGGLLAVDKLTGNEDLSWTEVGTETGIAGGSLLTGLGVSRLVGRGAQALNTSGRSGRIVLGGGTFVAEELTSEGLINAGSAVARGEDITAGTLLDPVGLLYGLPFASRDAAGVIRGSSSPRPNTVESLQPPPGHPPPPPPPPSPEQMMYNDLFAAAPAARLELSGLSPAELRAVFGEGGPYPRSAGLAAEVRGFANLAKNDPHQARVVADATYFYGRDVIYGPNGFNNPNNNFDSTLTYWRNATPKTVKHPSNGDFLVRRARRNRPSWMPELEVAAGPNLDHNGFLGQITADRRNFTSVPGGTVIRPHQIIDGGQPRTDFDGVAFFSAHGSSHGFQGATNEEAADLMYRSIASAHKAGRPIDTVVLNACNQRNCRADLRSNGQEFQRRLNKRLTASGLPEVRVFAASRAGPVYAGEFDNTQPRPRLPGRAVQPSDHVPTRFRPASAGPRPTTDELFYAGVGATAGAAAAGAGALVYTLLTEDE